MISYANVIGGGYSPNLWAGYAGSGSTTSPAVATNPEQAKGWQIVNNVLGIGSSLVDIFNKAKHGKEAVQGSIYNPNNMVDSNTYNGGTMEPVTIFGNKPLASIQHEIDYKPLMLIGLGLGAIMLFKK